MILTPFPLTNKPLPFGVTNPFCNGLWVWASGRLTETVLPEFPEREHNLRGWFPGPFKLPNEVLATGSGGVGVVGDS